MKRMSMFLWLFGAAMLMFTACKTEKPEEKSTGNEEQTEEATSVEKTDAINPGDLPGETYAINASEAQVNWYATKVGGKHNGTVNVKDGFLKVEEGEITGGAFTLDMHSINVQDLDGEWKMKLERHLKGLAEGKEDHFFNVVQYPTAEFVITKVTELDGSDSVNKMVYGDLTIKGVTNPVGMTARVKNKDERIEVEVAELIIDRTKWNVNYNSKKVFADLQDNIIHDDVKFSLGFQASKT